ncbi:MAG: monovalent cation/H(+) antiporter subunit G [Planctomycetes bacterium]|nr:monovalent cation/H(+) antiporter subunit G [Planctomycetota bacterium]
MQLFREIVVWVLLMAGAFFSLTAAVGVLRFPDFYTRLHPAGKNDTLGVLLFCSAMLIECFRYPEYGYLVAGRLVLMVLFMLMASPIACHAITQAAYVDGLRPWKKGDPRR